MGLSLNLPNISIIRLNPNKHGPSNDELHRSDQSHNGKILKFPKLSTQEITIDLVSDENRWKEFHFQKIDLDLLRARILEDLDTPYLPFPKNPDLAVSDWVKLTILLGNDFIPMLVGIDNGKEIDILVSIWKEELPKMEGYITTKMGDICWERFQKIMEYFEQPGIVPFSDENISNQRDMYYKRYLGIPPEDEAAKLEATLNYVEGLHWQMKSFLVGCLSCFFLPTLISAIPSRLKRTQRSKD